MKEISLSLCMIAKNEAENIGRCINSVKDAVDEIIVVDTGSADKTIEIAKSLGARVIREKWKNDFSYHRNTSLENASGDWIIFLDCDEEVEANSAEKLKEVIKNTSLEAFFVQITNLLKDNNEITLPSIRLFRNRKYYRFEGKIHEQIVNSIVGYSGHESIGYADIHVIHHGYNPEQCNIKAKILRNLNILKNYPGEKRNGFFFFNLGTEYLRLGNFQKAFEYFRVALEKTKPANIYGPVLVKKTITTLMDLKRYRYALQLIDYYLGIYPSFKDLVALKGICHLNCGRFSRARDAFEEYIDLPEPPKWFPSERRFGNHSITDLLTTAQNYSIDSALPAISVCIIGRNEQANLVRCLQSINEIASEVIYVDTGSSDNSPELAYQYGAKVFKINWDDDFAKVRNYAIEQAEGEWIFFIDADEELSEKGRSKLVQLFQNNYHDAFLVKVFTFLDNELSPDKCQVKGMCRLFKNAGYYYRGCCFEDIKASIIESYGTIASADIEIYHLHYLSDMQRIKEKKKFKLEAIEKLNEELITKKFALGVEAFLDQDYSGAIDYFVQIYEQMNSDDKPEYYFYYAQSLMNTKDVEKAAKVLNKGLDLYPDYTDLLYLKGIISYLLGEREEAERLFLKCIELGDAPWDKYLVNNGTGSFKAMISLATIYNQEGKYKEALQLLLEAATIPDGFKQALEGLVFSYQQLETTFPFELFLKDKNLLNPRTLFEIAKVFTRMGDYREALKYFKQGYDLLVNMQQPDVDLFVRTTNQLIFLVSRQMGISLSSNSRVHQPAGLFIETGDRGGR